MGFIRSVFSQAKRAGLKEKTQYNPINPLVMLTGSELFVMSNWTGEKSAELGTLYYSCSIQRRCTFSQRRQTFCVCSAKMEFKVNARLSEALGV